MVDMNSLLTVKANLQELLDINQDGWIGSTTVAQDGSVRPANANDLIEENQMLLRNICKILGMKDLISEE